jgi:hypothetical protein
MAETMPPATPPVKIPIKRAMAGILSIPNVNGSASAMAIGGGQSGQGAHDHPEQHADKNGYPGRSRGRRIPAR